MGIFEELTIKRGDNEDSAALCDIEIRQYLKRAAEETIYYVALGNVLKCDLIEKFGLSERNVLSLLNRNALELGEAIKGLK